MRRACHLLVSLLSDKDREIDYRGLMSQLGEKTALTETGWQKMAETTEAGARATKKPVKFALDQK